MDDDLSGWALQNAAEVMGYENPGFVPDNKLDDLYDLAEFIDD